MNKYPIKTMNYILPNGAGAKPDVEDVPVNLHEENCDHQCTSSCRREGCNCECGEFHEMDED